MSLFGALAAGVSGLAAQSQAMGVISDNITNVNTIGYKNTKTEFSTLVTQTQTASAYVPGGVTAVPIPLVDRQGLLQASASPTDLAITGNGFFVANTNPQPTSTTGTYQFTRAGSFLADENGFLRNAAGLYLQGYRLDASGNIPANRSDLTVLETVNINALTGSATATTTIGLKANLQSSQTAGAYTAGDLSAGNVDPHFARSVQLTDSKGGSRTLTFGFYKDAALSANQWQAEIYADPATQVTNTNGLLSSGIVAFNTDGSIDLTNTTLATTLNVTTWNPTLGIADSTITLDLGTDGATDGLTQFDSSSVLIASDVNGAVFGALTGVTINEDGVLTALFDNGARQDVYKLPIATFPNPNGLGNKPGNAYIATDASGNFNLQEAGVGGAGKVAAGALESSTVDLADEFTKMIITQRAYSASSKVITTADEMLDELIRSVR
ncbi:MAG: flagellar hook protein FlgE [Alphaproteobacteria bacterium]